MSISSSYDEVAVDRLVAVLKHLPVREAHAVATQFQQAWTEYIILTDGFVSAFDAVAVLYDVLAEHAARERKRGRL